MSPRGMSYLIVGNLISRISYLVVGTWCRISYNLYDSYEYPSDSSSRRFRTLLHATRQRCMQLGVRNHFESNKPFTIVPIDKNKRPTSLAMAPKKLRKERRKRPSRQIAGKLGRKQRLRWAIQRLRAKWVKGCWDGMMTKAAAKCVNA